MKFTMCFAEWEERNPWSPLHVERGFNQDDSVLIVMKNGYTSATGWQFLPSSPKDGDMSNNRMSIEKTIKALGIPWQRKVHTYNIRKMVKTLREAMTTTQARAVIRRIETRDRAHAAPVADCTRSTSSKISQSPLRNTITSLTTRSELAASKACWPSVTVQITMQSVFTSSAKEIEAKRSADSDSKVSVYRGVGVQVLLSKVHVIQRIRFARAAARLAGGLGGKGAACKYRRKHD